MKILKKHQNKIFIIITVILIIVIGNYFTSDNSQTKQQTSFNIEEVKKGNISEKVLVTGRVESANYLSINTSVNGIVKKIYVKEGDKVVKGQKITEIKLSNDGEIDYQNALVSHLGAKISLEKARVETRLKESDYILKL